MRWTPVIIAIATLAVAACQPSAEDTEADFTSGPAPEAPPADDGPKG